MIVGSSNDAPVATRFEGSRARRYLTTLRERPAWVVMRAIARFDVVRSAMRAVRRAPAREAGATVFPDLDTAAALRELEADGVVTGLELPAAVVEEILAFVDTAPCYGDQNTLEGFRYAEADEVRARVPRFCLTARYAYVAESCPAVKALTTDGKLLELATKYLRCEPVLQTTILWWSFAGESSDAEKSSAAQLFHYDVDDYRFLKFFFYLTDIDEDAGPHVVVRGTHRRKKVRHQLRMRRHEDAEIVRHYTAEKIQPMLGPVGSGFAEDTCAFHKGAPPRTKDRLVLQLEFATRDYGFQHWSDVSRAGAAAPAATA